MTKNLKLFLGGLVIITMVTVLGFAVWRTQSREVTVTRPQATGGTGQCLPPSQTHLECINNSCVRKIGTGSNQGGCTTVGAVCCPTGQTVCGSVCKNLQTDTSNCGTCGNACNSGQVCTGGSCVTPQPTCNATNCAGCCQGNVCQSGTALSACGIGAATCAVCGSGQLCNSGSCTRAHKECSNNSCTLVVDSSENVNDNCVVTGQSCVANSCSNRPVGFYPCNDTTGGISGGICDASGTCKCTIDSQCSTGKVCINGGCGTPVSLCGPTTCPGGCCQGNVCQVGNTATACGTGGAACSSCTTGQACSNSACVNSHKECTNSSCTVVTGQTGTDSCVTTGQACSTNTCTNRPNGYSPCNDTTTNITGGTCDTNGVCKCTADPQCPAGKVCTNGSCTLPQTTCSASNCSGCCQGTTCVTPNGVTACGTGGVACTACVPNEVSACWGNSGTNGRCYDCNADSKINILDFSCFAKHWQESVQ